MGSCASHPNVNSVKAKPVGTTSLEPESYQQPQQPQQQLAVIPATPNSSNYAKPTTSTPDHQTSDADKLFKITEDVIGFYKAITTKRIQLDCICEKNFNNQRSLQDVINLYLCLRLGQYFSQEVKCFRKIKESCNAELAKRVKDGTGPDNMKYAEQFLQAQEVFEEIQYKDSKDKLSVVSKDPVTDSDGFIKRRIDSANQDLDNFVADLQKIIDESNATSKAPEIKCLDLEANVKKAARTKEKVLEMAGEEKKYPKPTEDWLYDLIRCRVRISPTATNKDKVKSCLELLKTFLKKLEGGKFKIIRFKNKMAELGVLALNVVYKTHIAEIQIVFSESFTKLNESHIVYDISRTKDFNALKRYMETLIAVKHFKGLFHSLKHHTIYDLNNVMTQEGSVSMIPLFTTLIGNPEFNDTIDVPVTVKGKYNDKVIDPENTFKITVTLRDCEAESDGWPSFLTLRLIIEQEDDTRNYLTGKGIRYDCQPLSDKILNEEEVEVRGISEDQKCIILMVYSNTNKKIKHNIKCRLEGKDMVVIDDKKCGFFADDKTTDPIKKNPLTTFVKTDCPKKHPLSISNVEKYECSKCNIKVTAEKHATCGKCSYNLCKLCLGLAVSEEERAKKTAVEDDDDEKDVQNAKASGGKGSKSSKPAKTEKKAEASSDSSEKANPKCPEGHSMKMLAREDCSCDECEDDIEDYEKHWVCKRCNYDRCNSCAKGGKKESEEPQLLPTKDKNGKLQCINDHIMLKGTREASCDVCGDEIDEDEKHYICYQCNYDLCNQCLSKCGVKKAQNDTGPKFKCPEGHVAKLVSLNYHSCDLCSDGIGRERHPYCDECDYDACLECVKLITSKSKPNNGYYTLEIPESDSDAKFKCPEGHVAKLAVMDYHRCDLCCQDIDRVRHPYCSECDYDTCLECAEMIVKNSKPENGYYVLEYPESDSDAKFKCPEGHVAKLTVNDYHSCDLCGESTGYERHHYCSECDYDTCVNCVKVITTKSQPVDGYFKLEFPKVQTDAKFKCPDGHVLASAALHNRACDNCGNSINGSQKHLCCKQCGVDICSKCENLIALRGKPKNGFFVLGDDDDDDDDEDDDDGDNDDGDGDGDGDGGDDDDSDDD